MNKLLLEEEPLVILPALAKEVGLNECIVLQQLHYWLRKSKHIKDGRKWIYNTYDGWKKQFPFWSESTIRRTLTSLEKQELIITGNFNKMKFDKTKWYTINYEKVKIPKHLTMMLEEMYRTYDELLFYDSECESPIEKMLGVALHRKIKSFEYGTGADCFVDPQEEIEVGDKKYRVDFKITCHLKGTTKEIVVECDGHNFHEKTKEQAARDKKRDRAIQTLGMPIIRFTGSEIWNNPYKCANEVIELLRTVMTQK